MPINPRRAEVGGLTAHLSVAAAGGTFDHAYVLLDSDAAVEAVDDCGRAGVRVVTVLADGFAEAGPAGAARQQRIKEIAAAHGIFLIGPNSMGVVDTRSGFFCTTNAVFRDPDLPSGRTAIVSQSGSLIGTMASRGAARGLGFSTSVSVGNEASATVADVADVLLDDPGTDAIILFLETIRDHAGLARMARRARGLGKPVVAYAIGRSAEGQALAVSHTGAMTGGLAALDAFLRASGVVRVDIFESVFEAPPALRLAPRLDGRPRAATVVTTTGGGGAMVIDQLSLRGVPVRGASPASVAALRGLDLPIGRGTLVDVTLAGARYEVMRAVFDTLLRDPETGVLIAAIGSSAQFNPELAVQPIVDAVADAGADGAPVLAFPLPEAPETIRLFAERGVPSFRTVEACAEAVAALVTDAGDHPDQIADDEPAATRIASQRTDVDTALDAFAPGTADEWASYGVFRALGVDPAPCVRFDPDAPLPVALPFAGPVVAKLLSPDLPHKSDAGAVATGIGSVGELEAAIARMRASVAERRPDATVRGVLVQQMCRGVGEALIGYTRDPVVGPMISVGMGGIAAEIYRDVSLRPAPVTHETARAMIDEVKGFALLKGYRGRPMGDIAALADLVATVSRLATCPRVREAELNPVIVCGEGEGAVAVDALVTAD